MGLYPQKGLIAPGSDADLAPIDPDRSIAVDFAALETNADWSRGRQVVADHRFVGERGRGRWLPRAKAGALD